MSLKVKRVHLNQDLKVDLLGCAILAGSCSTEFTSINFVPSGGEG